MVDAGRVIFQVGIDRPSIDRATADLERRLSTAGDIDLRINTPALTAALGGIEQRLDSISTAQIRIDTSQAQLAINSLEDSLDRVGSNSAVQQLNRLQGEIRDTGEAARDADRPIGNLNATLQAFQGAAAFVALDRLVDLFGQLAEGVAGFAQETLEVGVAARNAETSLTTILGSAEEAQAVLQDLSDFAATTPFDLPGIRAAGQQLLAFGFETNELIPTLNAVGNVAAGVNVPFDELAEIYGKARVQGRLFAEDINQLTGRGVPIIAEFAAQFGVAEGEVRGLVESGQIGFSELEQAFINLSSEGGKFFDLLAGQSATVGGQLSNIGDTVTQFQEQLFRAFEPALGAGLETLTRALDEAASSSEALDILSAAGERLAISLRENPELAERLGQALARFADSGAEAVAAVLDRINQALQNPENIEAFASGIENIGQSLQEITSAAVATLDSIVALIDGLERLGLATSLEEFSEGGVGSFNRLQENIQNFDGVNLSIGFDGKFDGPLSRLLGLADEPLEVEVETPDLEARSVAQQDVLDKQVRAAQQASDEVAENDAAAARRAASERNRINAEAVEEFERTQKEAIAAIELAQSDRIAGVLQNQAASNITSGQADSQIAEIEADAIRERIALREQEITQIQQLETQGALSAEDAAEQIAQARQTTSDLVIQSIEAEIGAQERAKDAALERLDVESRLSSLQAEQVNIQSNIASAALQDQSNLISAQVSLEQSRLSLSRQTLDAKLSEATAAKDVLSVEDLRDRILINQRQSIAAEFNARRQQLQIQQQLAQLDADRQLRLGQIAEAEARIAVERARVEGSSQEEIQGLEEIARLREQETQALESQANSKRNILAVQAEQLDLDQAIAEQRATQERRDAAIAAFRQQQKDLADSQLRTEKELTQATEQRARAADSIVSALSGLQDIGGEDALGSLGQLEENLRSARRAGFGGSDASQLQQAIYQAQRLARSGDGFSVDEAFRFAQRNSDNQFAGGVLDAVGLGGVSSFLDAQQEVAIADSQIETLTTKLDEVRLAVENLEIPTGIQSLSVSTPDPVVDAATVAAQVGRQQRIARGQV
ncbi:MAG: tape measure protein [Cyanobacteria bacterium P01_F01_bin.13]